jgi:hypothetical protein
VSTNPRRPGILQLGSRSCWINQFPKHAGKVTAKNQLAAGSGPAGTAGTAAWHGFLWPVCIVPPTLQPKVWCSALCLAFLHIPVRAANPSSAAQLNRHMSNCTGADPALFDPQPAPQTIRAAGAACAVAMQMPAGAKRRAARKLPIIDRGKWGQHLYQIRSGWQSRASAQAAISWSPPCVGPAARFAASASWTTTAPSHPGRASLARRRRPRVPRPVRRLLPLRPRPPPATHAHILNPSGRFDVENGRSHISTTGVETKRTSFAPARDHPTATDSDSAAYAAADAFCDQMQSELDELLGGAQGDALGSSFPWQHGRCATHTLQLSVRAGLAIKPVCDLLDKVRLVAKLGRTSTNLQRQLELSAAAEWHAAEHSGSVRTATVHRRTLDCPTRWGSTLVIVEPSWRVASAVPAALSAYHSLASTGKKEVEALNGQQRSPMKDFHPGAKCPMPVSRHAMCLGLTCAIVTSLASSDLDRAMAWPCASFQNTENLTLAARFLVRPPARL